MKKIHTLCLLLLTCATLRAQEDGPLPALEQASIEQQKSIAQLVAALKEVRKAIPPPDRKECKQQPKAKNPFKDPQEYKKEPPEKPLEQLLEKQKEVVDQLKNETGDSPEKLEGKQRKISEELKKLLEKPEWNPAVRQALDAARESSEKTKQALRESAAPEARIGAQKTYAKIGQALNELRREAGKNAEEALDKAAQELNAADRAMRNKNGKQAAKKAEEAQETLEDALRQQRETGSKEKEGILKELVEKMRKEQLVKALGENPDAETTARKLSSMQEAVAKARQGDRSVKEQLNEAMQALREMRKEMQYRARTPKEITNPQTCNMLAECEGAARRISRANKQMGGKGQAPSPSPIQDSMEQIVAVITQWEKRQDTDLDKEIAIEQMLDATEKVLIAAQQCLDALEKETVVRSVAADEVPKKYQDDVAAYFERLSRPDSE